LVCRRCGRGNPCCGLRARGGCRDAGSRVGVHGGQASGHTKWADTTPNGDIDATMIGQTANTDMSGAIYGGQAGCDWQAVGSFVAGLEGSLAAATLAGTNQDQFNFNWTLRTQTDWIGTVAGRAGWAVNHALLYGRGGVAWAHTKFEIENGNIFLGAPSATRFGFVVGAGVEWAFAPNLSAFAEGDYYRFQAQNVTFKGNIPLAGNPPFPVHTSESIETLKLGVNFRF
jgi:outer membrane immunogenic protein